VHRNSQAMSICFLIVAFTAGMRGEIKLPLDAEGLRAVRESMRREGLDATRQQLEQTIAAARAQGDLLSQAYGTAGLAGIAELSRNPELAERTLREAAVLAAKAGDHSLLGTTALWFGQESMRGGRPLRAVAWAKVAATEFRSSGDERNLARALYLESRSTTSDLNRRRLLLQALETARKGRNVLDIAVMEAEHGELMRLAGDFGGAIRILEAASLRLEQLDAWNEAGRALMLLARAYAVHSRYSQALDAAHKAEALLERSGEPHDLLSARQELGTLLAATGDRKRAVATFEQAHRDLLAHQDAYPSIRLRAAGLAHGYLRIGEYQKARDLASFAMRGAPARVPVIAYWILAASHYHLGNNQDAIDAAGECLSRAATPDDVSNVSAYRWRALAFDRLGRHEDAARDMLEAARIGDSVRGHLLADDESKRLFSDDRQQMVHDAIAVLWRAGKRMEAWQVAEQARARALLDMMAGRDTETTRQIATPLSPQQLTAAAARNGENIIAYWVHPEAVYVWLANSRGEVESVRVPLRPGQLPRLVDRARSFRYKPDLNAWRQLYTLLIQPVAGKLPREGRRMLSLLPHGPLLQIPFAALLGPDGRYLIEDYSLRAAPAAGNFENGKPAHKGRYVLIGDPRNPHLPALPGAKLEVERVASFAPAGVQLITGAQAQMARVRSEASEAQVLHFATHAIEDATQPFQSFLVLSDKQRLTAQAIHELRLSADLVMLTACRSGSGRISADGLLGFTRAFLYAGASSVIAPLWDIPDDATVSLVEEFYRLYTTKGNKADALRGAQLKVLQALRAGKVTQATAAGPMPLPEHPALWAGFVLQGAN